MNNSKPQWPWLKLGFVVSAVLLAILLPLVAPFFGIHEGGRIPLNGLQVLYAVLSVEIAAAVYVWGVGKWSRYEPPPIPTTSAPQGNGPAQTTASGPVSAAPSSAGTPAQGGK